MDNQRAPADNQRAPVGDNEATLGARAAAAVLADGVGVVDQLGVAGQPDVPDAVGVPVAVPAAAGVAIPGVPAAVGAPLQAVAEEPQRPGGPLGLYEYQLDHVEKLLGVYAARHSCALDSSDTGTGKTRTSVEICRRLNRRPFILCPKAVIPTWFDTCALGGVEPYGVANYEAAKRGKHYTSLNGFLTEDRELCPWITVIPGRVVSFRWSLDTLDDCILIIDEAHKGKNKLTACAKMLRATKRCAPTIRILMLSATISDKMETIHTLTYLLGLVQEGQHAFRRWAMMTAREAGETRLTAATVNRKIYPKYGARMEAAQTGNDAAGMAIFRKSDTRAEVYAVTPAEEVELAQRYAELNRALEMIKMKQFTDDAPLVLLLRARQRIELLKVATVVDQTAQLLADGYSVVIFVNFRETLARIFERIVPLVSDEYHSSIVIIEGGQTSEERQEQIRAFQDDEARVALVMISAGGTGVSLHDVGGVFPRATLIMPPWSGVDLMQALGRVHRAGAQSDDIQRVVYISGALSKAPGDKLYSDCTIAAGLERKGVEEYIADALNTKLGVIEGINRGDTGEALVLRPDADAGKAEVVVIPDELRVAHVLPADDPPIDNEFDDCRDI